MEYFRFKSSSVQNFCCYCSLRHINIETRKDIFLNKLSSIISYIFFKKRYFKQYINVLLTFLNFIFSLILITKPPSSPKHNKKINI